MFTYASSRGALRSALALLLAASLCATAAGVARADAGHVLEVREDHGISYVSGGVGRDEEAQLNQMSGRFNLKLTMANSTGEYVSPASLRIADHGGRTVLETTPDGPVFFARVPAGEYTVQATAQGQALNRTIQVPATGQASATFTWKSDGQTMPRAPEARP